MTRIERIVRAVNKSLAGAHGEARRQIFLGGHYYDLYWAYVSRALDPALESAGAKLLALEHDGGADIYEQSLARSLRRGDEETEHNVSRRWMEFMVADRRSGHRLGVIAVDFWHREDRPSVPRAPSARVTATGVPGRIPTGDAAAAR